MKSLDTLHPKLMLLPVADASTVNGIIVPAAGHLDSFNAPGSRKVLIKLQPTNHTENDIKTIKKVERDAKFAEE